jgi:hypothetical protein
MRAVATGDAGPQLNPSGISLLRAYLLEGSYQYGSTARTRTTRAFPPWIPPPDSISAARFTTPTIAIPQRRRDSNRPPCGRVALVSAARQDLPGWQRQVHSLHDETGTTHSGFTFDAGLTIRPIPQLSIGAVGYNLLDHAIQWAPKSRGGGIAVLPMPILLFVFDSVMEKVYGDSTRDSGHVLHGRRRALLCRLDRDSRLGEDTTA